jgi:hypothetical protein
MSDAPRFARSPHVLRRRTLDTVVLLAVEGDEPVILAGTGADVWSLLVEARTLDELVDMLAAHYSGDPDVIATDVSALLDTLVTDKLVLRIESP